MKSQRGTVGGGCRGGVWWRVKRGWREGVARGLQAGWKGEEVVYARLWHFAFFKLSADRRYLAVDTKQAHATRFFIRKDKKKRRERENRERSRRWKCYSTSTQGGGVDSLRPPPASLFSSFFFPTFCNGNGSDEARLLQRELPTARFDYAPCAQKRFKPQTRRRVARGARDLKGLSRPAGISWR